MAVVLIYALEKPGQGTLVVVVIMQHSHRIERPILLAMWLGNPYIVQEVPLLVPARRWWDPRLICTPAH